MTETDMWCIIVILSVWYVLVYAYLEILDHYKERKQPMIWGDKKIKRKLFDAGLIQFSDKAMINPASVNIRLGNSFLTMRDGDHYKLGDPIQYKEHHIEDGKRGFILYPGQFCLATTMEKIQIPNDAVAFVQGRSSIGRIGLTVQNAGYVDPGFFGHITLELVNESPCSLCLPAGYPVAQLVFMDCTKVNHPYSGKYIGQRDATGSRMYLDKLKYNHLIGGESE